MKNAGQISARNFELLRLLCADREINGIELFA